VQSSEKYFYLDAPGSFNRDFTHQPINGTKDQPIEALVESRWKQKGLETFSYKSRKVATMKCVY